MEGDSGGKVFFNQTTGEVFEVPGAAGESAAAEVTEAADGEVSTWSGSSNGRAGASAEAACIRAFVSMLNERGVKAHSSWEEALPKIVSDKR